MSEFADLPLENFVQRLDRCQAYRFRHPAQAPELASLLRGRSFTFAYGDDSDWILTIDGKLDSGSEELSQIVIHRGDFIVLKDFARLNYEIVPAPIFREKFDREES